MVVVQHVSNIPNLSVFIPTGVTEIAFQSTH